MVLKESNEKLAGLIWLLNCSIKMLDSITLTETDEMRVTRADGFNNLQDLEQGLNIIDEKVNNPDQLQSVIKDGQIHQGSRNNSVMSFGESHLKDPRQKLK